ncbi:unnamed protein product [Oppiella nova]|uniref:PD-(D/E)XK endonuclease-like domain-containing protein n=1 Tax=Oppiella nova TaxID=334625 RepID=A0A7R9Q9V0_9ACAR|nr:unnamed protein product [Oppiella nova]CAG2161105.1 unnamed protein product [Oppiella nova]
MIGQEPKISEFEQYTKNYDKMKQRMAKNSLVSSFVNEAVQYILNISTNILHNNILPPYTQKIWQIKFNSIAKDFIEFDEQRRNNIKYIYSELKGELLLNIADHQLKIIATADRIEVDKKGNATILDYKTGMTPTKKDIISGLSPQLIIEALILLEGVPYIQTTEIDLTQAELNNHKTDKLMNKIN